MELDKPVTKTEFPIFEDTPMYYTKAGKTIIFKLRYIILPNIMEELLDHYE